MVVSYNTREVTLEALESLLASRHVEVEVWLVDNASIDGTAEAARKQFPSITLLELSENVGFGQGNNAALAVLDAPYVLFFNSDAVFARADGLAALVSTLRANPKAGVVGPRVESPGGQLEYSARAFPSLASELVRALGLHRMLSAERRERWLASEFRDHYRAGPADWLTGACLLAREEVITGVGGFDPKIFLYGEELDWCWRVHKAGWELHFEPTVSVIHRRGLSSGDSRAPRLLMAMAGDAYVVRKHRGWWYLGFFAGVRALGLALAAAVQGVGWLATGDETRARRSRHATAALAGWLKALAAGASRDPSSVARGPTRNV